MALINNTDRYHLFYLFVNDIREDQYHGLSHVAEHTLLIPVDIGLDFIAQGYTCMNHVSVYFESETLSDLQEIDKKIMCGEVITEKNVNCAKSQVIDEIMYQSDKTAKFEKMISFVTENRIQKSVIGDPSEVSSIHTDDIIAWFEKKRSQGQIYRFLFKDAHNMIMSTGISQNCILQTLEPTSRRNCTGGDSFHYTVLPTYAKTIQIYFQIASLYSKIDVIKKAVYEYCIQRKMQDSLGIEASIADNYFDTHERFVLIEIPWNNASTVQDIIMMIRTSICSINQKEYQLYVADFKKMIMQVMTRRELNTEIINSVKNSIIYCLPKINIEDMDLIDLLDYSSFPKEWIADNSIKVVIS